MVLCLSFAVPLRLGRACPARRAAQRRVAQFGLDRPDPAAFYLEQLIEEQGARQMLALGNFFALLSRSDLQARLPATIGSVESMVS
jgi:hypothetical protein